MIHQVNISIHILAGTAGIIIGLITLIFYKHTERHKRFGRYFLWLLSIVVSTGFLGWLFYRQNPFLLMLTLLSGYVGYAGYRAVRLREKKGELKDVALAFLVLFVGLVYLFWLQQTKDTWSPTVIYSTVGALMLVTIYDLSKFFLLYERIKSWWLYEHIYKMISAFSALLSAFSGTVLSGLKPYSQVGPSILGVGLIVFFIFLKVRKNNAVLKNEHE